MQYYKKNVIHLLRMNPSKSVGDHTITKRVSRYKEVKNTRIINPRKHYSSR